MGPVFLNTAYVESHNDAAHAVGPLGVSLGLDLCLFAELRHETCRVHVGPVRVLVVKRLRAQVLADEAAVRRESRKTEAQVLVDLVDLLLVLRKLGWGPVECCQDRVGRGTKAYAQGTLLDRLHCVLDLEETALRTPGYTVGIVGTFQHFLLERVEESVRVWEGGYGGWWEELLLLERS